MPPDSPQSEAARLRAASGLSAIAHEFRPASDHSGLPPPLAAAGLAVASALSPTVAAWVPGGAAGGAVAEGGGWSRSGEPFAGEPLAKPPGFYSMW